MYETLSLLIQEQLEASLLIFLHFALTQVSISGLKFFTKIFMLENSESKLNFMKIQILKFQKLMIRKSVK